MKVPVQDPSSEREAKDKIESILEDPKTRKQCLSMLADAIVEVNFYGRDKWAITNTRNYPDGIWLQAGHYAILTLERNSVWLALDKQLVESRLRGDIRFDIPNEWGWTPQEGGLSQYKDKYRPADPISINGYYKPPSEEAYLEIWPRLRRLHFEFIYKVVYVGQSMRSDTKALHLPGVLKYLRNELGRHMPDPLY